MTAQVFQIGFVNRDIVVPPRTFSDCLQSSNDLQMLHVFNGAPFGDQAIVHRRPRLVRAVKRRCADWPITSGMGARRILRLTARAVLAVA